MFLLYLIQLQHEEYNSEHKICYLKLQYDQTGKMDRWIGTVCVYGIRGVSHNRKTKQVMPKSEKSRNNNSCF